MTDANYKLLNNGRYLVCCPYSHGVALGERIGIDLRTVNRWIGPLTQHRDNGDGNWLEVVTTSVWFADGEHCELAVDTDDFERMVVNANV